MAERPGGGRRVRPGGHPLRREVIVHHQRQRILTGAAAVIAERGYRSVSVADIVKSAAIARARFYEHFGSKEDCFFALYESGTQAALSRVSDACSAADGQFPERVRAGLGALLTFIDAEPALARACIVEGPAVGDPINERFERMIGEFAALLRQGRTEPATVELPETVEETVVGGLYWLLYYALTDGRPKQFEQLLPQLVEFSLIPFNGAESARSGDSA